MASDYYKLEFLENLVSIHDSERIPVKQGDRKKGIYPYYGASGITDYIDGYLFDGEYILLSEDGDNLRTQNTPIAFMATGKFWVNNHAHVIKGKQGNNSKFICYALQVADIRSHISGSTRPKITQKDMRKILISYPPIEEQKAIAHILGSLDDKIELNRQMNATLEAMAQALFKSWFVDFDPVLDNALAAGNPIPEELADKAAAREALGDARKLLPEDIAAMFPAAFVFTEEMGWIPEGWEIGTLLDQADLISGGTPKTSIPEYWDGDVFWASAKDVSQCPDTILEDTERKITQAGLEKSSTKLIDQFATVIVSRGATTGRLVMFGGSFAMNQTCYALRSKAGTPFFQYYLSANVISKLVNSAHGSVFDTITTDTFKSTKIILPDLKTSKAFEDRVKTHLVKLHSNLKNTAALYKLRDTLLPKLLSGELRIPETEKLAEEALS